MGYADTPSTISIICKIKKTEVLRSMICRRCGKDIVGTNKCLYCGKILDDFVSADGVDGGGASTTKNVFSEAQPKNEPASDAYQDYGSSYGNTEYGDTSYMDYDDDSSETFYQHHKETCPLEIAKKAIDGLKIFIQLVFMGVILSGFFSILAGNSFLPELFRFDVDNFTEQDLFEFMNKIFMALLLSAFVPNILFKISEIFNWLSMKKFAENVEQSELDGKSLLTRELLMDKKRKKEYVFISTSLCMQDDPSLKVAKGVQVIISAILSLAFAIVSANFISYITLTLMPMTENPEDLIMMMYTTSDFWLEPNILSFGIVVWAQMLASVITGHAVSKRYNQWVKNIKTQGETRK